ncbi:hypothetical protein GOODEAATRI_011309 [Goodea atripinnis]|uniref:Uncharacterized protein n=1 Tax=Goodea atripinnis TaxID=208336 RepID=A0ABV0PD57_9TELE
MNESAPATGEAHWFSFSCFRGNEAQSGNTSDKDVSGNIECSHPFSPVLSNLLIVQAKEALVTSSACLYHMPGPAMQVHCPS